jgi:hypothetical protein
VVYSRDGAGENGWRHALHDASLAMSPPPLAASFASRFETPSVVTGFEARDDGYGPYPELAPLFADFAATQLICASVRSDALLILIERRRDRIFTAEERDMLAWIVRHARLALARVGGGDAGLSR